MTDMMKNIRIVEVYSDIAGYKKGASLGIDALKASSKELNADYFEKLQFDSIEDDSNNEGESQFAHAKYADVIEPIISKLAHKIKDIRNENKFPIVLAGDHSSCAGTMHGLKMAHPDAEIGVVYIDAENVVFCAVRDYQEEEMDLIRRHKIPLYSVAEITQKGISSTVEEIFKKLEYCDHIYVSFDVDSVDPLYVPGTGTPAMNGLSYEQAMQLNIELIKNKKVCCWEMAEINPLYNNSKDDSTRIFKILEKVTQSLLKNY